MIDGDKKLIQRAMGGEAEAFGLLYDRYQPQIYRFILIKVGHREEAEDLTHQVFLKSWQNIGGYTFQGFPFSSWLYSVARNQVIEEVTELRIENPHPAATDKELDAERIKKAILHLKNEQQDVIILRFIEDLSPQETALIMDKSEGAIKLLQHRAIKNLKKILNLKS